MKNSFKPTVLMGTEGSYPYSGGGVSTWAHILCNELKEEIDFVLFAVTGSPQVTAKYKISENVTDIIHIPLWGSEEPSKYFNAKVPFSQHVLKKSRTDKRIIRKLFVPLFRDFLKVFKDPYCDTDEISEIIYGFWKYFQHFDYKKTMREPVLWLEFKQIILEEFDNSIASNKLRSEEPKVLDLTNAMRWFYHFLMPLAAPIPSVDVTHSTLAGFPALAAIAARYEYGTASLVTDHGVYMRERLINLGSSEMPFFSKKFLTDLSTLVTRAVYGSANQISPVTLANKEWEMKFEAEEKKIKPIYNGVDADRFRPTPKPEHTENQPTVIAVANVFPLKDIETMIKTCHFVRKEINNVKFIVYGSLDIDKEYVQKCRSLVHKLDLEDYFELAGFHDKPHMIFNEGDISILTSISEGFPYTIIESMSCGRPVVATDVGGISEALEGCGFLCKPRDPEGIADSVIKLLTDDDLRIEMGRKARERVLLNYTTELSVEAYLNTYKTLSEEKKIPLKHQVKLPSVSSVVQEFDKIEYV